MGLKKSLTRSRTGAVAAVVAVCALAGCAAAPRADGINDPFETTNRSIHAFNREVDRTLVGPASEGYGSVVPDPARRVVGNLADTLDLPGDIVNNLLQLRVDHAAQNTLRLATNLTFGVFGLLDASTAFGLPGQPTDFGQTLHVWGVGEGPYLELPFSGPTTVRDATGTLVDLVTNPVRLAVPAREARAANALKLLSRLGDRERFSATFESVLYDSADSYAQARLLYLQNRRFQLEGGNPSASDDAFIDPYEDPYAE